MNVVIRPMRGEDLEFINCNGFESLWKDIPPDIQAKLDKKEFGDIDLEKLRDKTQAPCGNTWVAEVGGKLCGFITLGENLFPETNIRMGCVHDIFVSQNLRGKGIGKQLLNFAENEVRKSGNDYIGLLVQEQNMDAKKIYEKMGFKPFWTFLYKSVKGE